MYFCIKLNQKLTKEEGTVTFEKVQIEGFHSIGVFSTSQQFFVGSSAVQDRAISAGRRRPYSRLRLLRHSPSLRRRSCHHRLGFALHHYPCLNYPASLNFDDSKGVDRFGYSDICQKVKALTAYTGRSAARSLPYTCLARRWPLGRTEPFCPSQTCAVKLASCRLTSAFNGLIHSMSCRHGCTFEHEYRRLSCGS